jgi:hypothetical protein
MRSKNHRLRRGLALATVIGAIAAPTASAARVDPGGVDVGYASPYSPTSERTQPAPVVSEGFDWGDAGIGAAAILALAAIGAGTTVAIGYRSGRSHTVAE